MAGETCKQIPHVCNIFGMCTRARWLCRLDHADHFHHVSLYLGTREGGHEKAHRTGAMGDLQLGNEVDSMQLPKVAKAWDPFPSK